MPWLRKSEPHHNRSCCHCWRRVFRAASLQADVVSRAALRVKGLAAVFRALGNLFCVLSVPRFFECTSLNLQERGASKARKCSFVERRPNAHELGSGGVHSRAQCFVCIRQTSVSKSPGCDPYPKPDGECHGRPLNRSQAFSCTAESLVPRILALLFGPLGPPRS